MFQKLSEHARELKDKYHKMDSDTKKKILTGVGGALALLASIGIMRKLKPKGKSKDDVEE
ncbi:MAG: hypothetical protein WC505_04310 [Patescibacteria group bacterium]